MGCFAHSFLATNKKTINLKDPNFIWMISNPKKIPASHQYLNPKPKIQTLFKFHQIRKIEICYKKINLLILHIGYI